MGPRRLATAAVDSRPCPRFQRPAGRERERVTGRSSMHSVARALENDRQPAPHAVGTINFACIVAGWTLPPAAAAMWTAFIVATIAIAADAPVCDRNHAAAARHLQAQPYPRRRQGFALAESQLAMMLTLLAHQAWLMADAISRTLYRLFVSHRRLLEWTTAAQAKRTRRLDVRGFYARWPAAWFWQRRRQSSSYSRDTAAD